jgi:hypothetical protein
MTPGIPALLAYIGPEVTLPLASVLAALVGVVLMFWNLTWSALTKVVRFVFRLKTTPSSVSSASAAAASELTASDGQAEGAGSV